MKARKLGDYPRATTLIDSMPEEAVVSHRACDPAEHKRIKSLEQMILNGDRGVENFAATRRSRTGDLLITKQRANIQYVDISRTAEKMRHSLRFSWFGRLGVETCWKQTSGLVRVSLDGNWNGARTTRSASTKRVKTACQANSATRKDD
jgi:hypothetical protein